ncbi:MAG: response regulator [Dorea sp.]
MTISFELIQEQIKPHFLYNTLEMIKSMIDLGIYDEAGEAISTLARFYRNSLSKGSNIITIATEIDMVKQYLYIEKLRHMEYFDYEIVCEKGTEQYVIPKLTLQPILENAIVHGTASDGRMCFVSLSIKNAADTVVITVKDDGNGIEPEKLCQLNKNLDRSAWRGKGFFRIIQHQQARVRLLYGTEYGIRLESEPGKGTIVILRIPKLEHLDETASSILERDQETAGESNMKKIVIIDDEYFFRQALIKYVRSFKDEFTVVGDAGNGKLGIELIEQYHPEIILIDISMPQMTGFDVISYIQKQALQTRFIIISGYDKFEYAQKAIQMGVQDFLLKPVTVESLHKSLRQTSERIDQEVKRIKIWRCWIKKSETIKII